MGCFGDSGLPHPVEFLPELGDPGVHRALRFGERSVCIAAHPVDFGFRLGLHLREALVAGALRFVEQPLQFGDLDVGGAAKLFAVFLRAVAKLRELGLRVAADFGGGGFSGLRHCPGALIGRRANDILRQRTHVSFEMRTGATEGAVEGLADLIVERHDGSAAIIRLSR